MTGHTPSGHFLWHINSWRQFVPGGQSTAKHRAKWYIAKITENFYWSISEVQSTHWVCQLKLYVLLLSNQTILFYIKLLTGHKVSIINSRSWGIGLAKARRWTGRPAAHCGNVDLLHFFCYSEVVSYTVSCFILRLRSFTYNRCSI